MAHASSDSSKGSIDPSLLAILCCPETKQPVSLLDEQQLGTINHKIEDGQVKNKGGCLVKERLDGALIRSDKNLIYPIREQIPIMLIEEGISLTQPSFIA